MKSRRPGIPALIALFALIGLADPGSSFASQDSAKPGVAQKAPVSSRALEKEARDPGTPFGAVRAYLQACRRGDWQAASQFLDFSSVPAATDSRAQANLARELKVVLDRTLPIQSELLSKDYEGNTEDGLPPNLERLGTVGRTEILLERSDDADERWYFAASTVEAIPGLYLRYGYGFMGRVLPPAMFEIVWLDLALWQWLGLLLAGLSAMLLGWTGAQLIRGIARRVLDRLGSPVTSTDLQGLFAPLSGLLAVGLFALGNAPLALSIGTYTILGTIEIAAAVFLATWLLLRGLDLASAQMERRWQLGDDRAAIAVLPLARRALKVMLLGLGLVALLQNVGFNVTGLIAGLGVGGLAVALAAQKSIANLFGGVSMVADRPVQVGDFCRYGDNKVGTIEEIGLRSTRIRTLDRTLVTIPNADFSELQLENFAARDRMRFHAVIGLRYETSADQLRHLLTAMRKLLVAHPMVNEDPARVRFVGFGAHSLDVEIFSYIDTNDWSVFLGVREDLLLRLMDLVAESGTSFAFPSQTLYLGRDSGIDQERARGAEERVRLWRERNELPFPNLGEDTIARLNDSADYPPRGSVAAASAEKGRTETPS